jgi:AcrR family transcriptional regulator
MQFFGEGIENKLQLINEPYSEPMGTAERRARERAELEEKILDAARALFICYGYDAVTLRRIAQEIEYAPSVIYSYF